MTIATDHSPIAVRRPTKAPTGKAGLRPGKRVARRSPEVARQEILDAAAWFLEHRPFSELTAGRLMEHTKISRSAFYVYFKDIEQLIEALVAGVITELREYGAQWAQQEQNQATALTSLLNNVVNLWIRRGPMFATVLDAAQIYPALAKSVQVAVAQNEAQIARMIASARSHDETASDTDIETASFLLLATQAYLKSRLGTGTNADPLKVHRTLQKMWQRILYPGQAKPGESL